MTVFVEKLCKFYISARWISSFKLWRKNRWIWNFGIRALKNFEPRSFWPLKQGGALDETFNEMKISKFQNRPWKTEKFILQHFQLSIWKTSYRPKSFGSSNYSKTQYNHSMPFKSHSPTSYTDQQLIRHITFAPYSSGQFTHTSTEFTWTNRYYIIWFSNFFFFFLSVLNK